MILSLAVLMGSHCVRDLQSLRDFFAAQPSPRSGASKISTRLFQARSGRVRYKMQRWYRMLFVFENVLRDFITQPALPEVGDDWFRYMRHQSNEKG